MNRWLLLAVIPAACHSATPAAADASSDITVSSDISVSSDITLSSDTPDGSTPPDDAPPRCGITGPLPAWAERPARDRITLRCNASFALSAQAWADGILRLRYLPRGEERPARPWAVIGQASNPGDVFVGARGEAVGLCAPGVDLTVDRACRVTVRDGAGHTLFSDGPSHPWTYGLYDGAVPFDLDNVTHRRWSLHPGDHLHGFGERNGPFERRGTNMVFWNTDPYAREVGGVPPAADPLYPSFPVWVTHREGIAWGSFLSDPHRLFIAVTRDEIFARTDGGVVDHFVFAGPSMAEVLSRYASVTGAPAMPPRWALGFHQSRWGYADAARVEAVASRFRELRIPADAMWLDIQHHRGFRTFTFDPATFGDPAGMTNRLRANGFRAVVIADPGLKADPDWDVYREGIAGDHFLRRPDGSLYAGIVWPGSSHFPDFTREATRQWWGDRVAGLSRQGVAGVWLDVNEPTVFPESGGGTIPDEVPTRGDGAPGTMGEVHNVYALLEARATYEGLRRAAPDRRPFVLTRAGFAGSQRYAAMWTGDVPSTWTGLRQTLPTLLGLGLSGMPFVGSDVGGYSGRPSPELFARWIALGSISPFFRGHVTNGVPDQEPWAFGPEVEAISRARIQERYRLLPYLYSLFDESARTGAPVLRPLIYEFLDETALATVEDEAMLGPWILVAPVLTQGASSRTVVLPRGRWVELDSGAVYEGPATITVDVTLAALPTFLREGAVVIRGPVRQHVEEVVERRVDVELVPGPVRTTTVRYDDAGDGGPDAPRSRVTWALQRTDEGMRLEIGPREGSYAPPAGWMDLRVRPVDAMPSAVILGAQSLERVSDESAAGARRGVWWYDGNDRALRVRLDDAPAQTLVARYATALATDRGDVRIAISVALPPGTPADRAITIATSANGWTHAPLTRAPGSDVARGEITVPRGRWFEYKFARGSWETVERYGDCAEARNRYGFGAAWPGRDDRVFQWRDRCP